MARGKGMGMVAVALGICATVSGILGIVGVSDFGGIFWMLSIVLGVPGLCFGLLALGGPAPLAAKVGVAGSVIALWLTVAQIVLVAISFSRQ